MTEQCDAALRPFPDDTEVRCTILGDHHEEHVGEVRDYAYDGSVTVVSWFEDDRRTYHGDWPGRCHFAGCVLPAGHRGGHVS